MATIKQIKDTAGNVHDILSTIGYGTCATAAATAAKVATISDTSWTLKVGSVIGIKYTYTNTAGSSTTPVTLNVNSTGAKNIWYDKAKYTSTSSNICGYAGRVIYYMYDGTYWVWMNCGALDGNSNTVPCIQIETAAATAAKTGTCTNYSLLAKSYAHANVINSNSAKSAITLNVNGKGAKPIYINGTASSASNYTLPAGTYIIYYDGTNYHFRTDGVLPNLPTYDPHLLVTYEELKNLRDSGKLIPGQKYRITDYITTTFLDHTQSAGHQFDIIVTALDNSTLSEIASACISDRDTYFDGCDLSAWKIWYCLDNDNSRFSWANEDGGTGVIYRMIDEWGNDCPYDFKNIMFEKWLYEDGAGIATEDAADFSMYCYTFSWQDAEDVIMDASIVGNNGYVTENYGYSENGGVYGNVIGIYIPGNGIYPVRELNSIVFLSTYRYREDNGIYYGCHSNTFGDNCYNNIFNNNCNFNTFGNNCYENTFGKDCFGNTFGKDCCGNTFGNYCYDNTFGTYFKYNTFGNDCCDNIFGNTCDNNTFGNNCNKNTFGTYFKHNTFGDECITNTFGNECVTNTFGNECYGNTFGDDCNENILGDRCELNIFSNSCYGNILGDFCYGNTFGNNCGRVLDDEDYSNILGNILGSSCNNNTFGNDCYSNIFGDFCCGNTLGLGCYENEFESECNSNTFGDYCNLNKFGEECNSNTFGNECYRNTFGVSCYCNTFEDRCQDNTFGEECYFNTFGNVCNSNSFGYECCCNTFGNNCSNNSFGNECYGNILGDYCNDIIFVYYCYGNIFGNYCYTNHFGEDCNNNKFGNNCYNNTFGDEFDANSFGNDCFGNEFGDDCYTNSLGNRCTSNHFGTGYYFNSLGNDCRSNTFGDDCYSNSFGNSCRNNTLGNDCSSNTFGEECEYIKFGNSNSIRSYYRYITIDNGNKYIYLYSITSSSAKYYQNIRIALGVNNTTTYKIIADSNSGQAYETWYRPSNSQTKNV